jgi:hypothetical protein
VSCRSGCPNFTASGCDFLQMPIRSRHFAVVVAIALLACGLSGCGTINEKLADGVGDYLPHWLGGLPADAPPRPGTAKYDEFMRERERQRLEPKVQKEDASQSSPSPMDPVH